MRMDRGRNSRVELLKIIAIILIVLSHSNPRSQALGGGSESCIEYGCTKNYQYLISWFFIFCGQLGNCIFVVCSSFFLQNNKTAKLNKIIHMWSDALLISAAYVFVHLLLGYELKISLIVKQFLPITFGESAGNWFVGCYIIFYMLHPCLNFALDKADKKYLASLLFALSLMWSLAPIILGDKYYYNKLVGFVFIYFLVGYIVRYREDALKYKDNIRWILLGEVTLYIASFAILNMIGIHNNIARRILGGYGNFTHPLFILIAFHSFVTANRKEWRNSAINTISSLSLLIYLIHENYLLRMYVKADYFHWIYINYSYNCLILWVLLLSLASLVISAGISYLYKVSIQKMIYRQEDKWIDLLLNIKINKCG